MKGQIQRSSAFRRDGDEVKTRVSGDILTLFNDVWMKARNYADSAAVSLFKLNTDDEIDVGAAMHTGPIEIVEDAGKITLVDMAVSATPTAGTEEGYVFKVDGDGLLTVGAEADSSGGIQNPKVVAHCGLNLKEITTPTAKADYGALYTKADNHLYFQDGAGVEHSFIETGDTYTNIDRICSGNLQSNPSNPPVVVASGITPGLRFTVGTDKVHFLYQIPQNYDSGDGTISLNWTKGTAATDESTKTVKWQLKYLGLSPGDNCNSGEATLSVQDTYDDSSTSTQVVYGTGGITIPAASLTAGHGLTIEISAITPSGTALADEPVLLGVVFACTCTKVN